VSATRDPDLALSVALNEPAPLTVFDAAFGRRQVMAKKQTTGPKCTRASGRVLVAFSNGLVLIDTETHGPAQVRPDETAAAIGKRLGQALKNIRLSRKVIFGSGKGRRKVYAYSVHPTDATLIVRESFDGKRTSGRMVDGKFRAVRTRRCA
jgi:hypothetical protein